MKNNERFVFNDRLCQRYIDRNGRVIHPGDHVLISGEDTPTLVVPIQGGKEWDDLGVSASNPAYLKNHPDAEEEFYSLSDFQPKHLTIIDKEDN